MKYTMLWTLVIMAAIFVGCTREQEKQAPASTGLAAARTTRDGHERIDADSLQKVLKTEDVTLVNVHIPYAGDIPGTDLQIPFNRIDALADRVPDKDAPVVLYCLSGSMSTSASRRLVDLGYTNVYELAGGMNAWRRAGLDLTYNN